MQQLPLFQLLLTSYLMIASTSLFASEASIRSSKTLGVGARAGYFTGIPGTGIDVYYNLGSNLQIGALYNKGEMSGGGSGGGSEIDFQTGERNDLRFESQAEMTATQAGAFARYYILDSFSITGGLVHRSINVTYSQTPSPFNANQIAISGNVTGHSLAALLQIGNRWSWQNGITIGADWIGYTLPVMSLGKSGSTSDMDALDFKDAERFRTAAAGASNQPILQGLMLDIGYMF